MGEETEDAGQGTQVCDMCDHAKHDTKTCSAEGCDCGTEEVN